MQLGSVKPDDIVRYDIKGQMSYGIVKAKGPSSDPALKRGEVMVRPIHGSERAVRIVTARQVREHFRKRKG